MSETILIVGGSGRIGERVARGLRQAGYGVRILSRDPQRVQERLDGFDLVAGDVTDPASLTAALDGCQGVHVSLAGGPDAEDYDRVEAKGTANVAAAAAAAAEKGLRRITYLSGATVGEENAAFPGTRAKLAAEQAIRDCGIPYTIFRCSWFMESLPAFVQGKRASMIGRQPHPVHLLAAEDFAARLALAYERPETENKTLTLFGPEAITLGQALERYCARVHPDLKTGSVPVWLMSAIAWLSRDAALKGVVQTMAYFERTPERGDPGEANRLLGAPTTTLEQWAQARR